MANEEKRKPEVHKSEAPLHKMEKKGKNHVVSVCNCTFPDDSQLHTCCLMDRTKGLKNEKNRATFIDRVKKIEKGAAFVGSAAPLDSTYGNNRNGNSTFFC
jgi:hypothetical protein